MQESRTKSHSARYCHAANRVVKATYNTRAVAGCPWPGPVQNLSDYSVAPRMKPSRLQNPPSPTLTHEIQHWNKNQNKDIKKPSRSYLILASLT